MLVEEGSEISLCYYTQHSESGGYKLFEVVDILRTGTMPGERTSQIKVRYLGVFNSPCLNVLHAAHQVVRNERERNGL